MTETMTQVQTGTVGLNAQPRRWACYVCIALLGALAVLVLGQSPGVSEARAATRTDGGAGVATQPHRARCIFEDARRAHRFGRRAPAGCRWQATWARSQSPNSTATPGTDRSIRVIARVRAGSVVSRIRLQNAFGSSTTVDGNSAVTVGAATVARRTVGASVDSRTIRRLTFSGRSNVTIAPGSYVVSDPVRLPVAAGQDVAISVYLPGTQVPAGHRIDNVTHYVTSDGAGNHALDRSGAAFSVRTQSTFVASAVESLLPRRKPGTMVAIGGSVVDGAGSTLDGYDSLPDQLADRVASELPLRKQMPVVNAGIAGTTAAAVCGIPIAGPGVEQRLKRDALSLAHVSRVLVWAGTNDLSLGCTGDQIIAAMTNIARQVQRGGAQVLISTITPRASYSSQQNAYRAQVNAWVRAGSDCSGVCAHALDFDAVLRDPAQPNRILPALDADGIHPNPAGYGRLARSVKLAYLVGRKVTDR